MVREKNGDHVLGYRLSANEMLEDGLKIDDTVKFAKKLEDHGVDYIHVSGGIYETLTKQSPPCYLPRNSNVQESEKIKKAVNLPIIVAGGITVPEEANRILVEGKADMVAMGRALLSDPEWPNKAFRDQFDDIRPCIRCNEEFNQLFEGKTVRCTVNFQLHREAEYPITPAAAKKRVMVVGSGPAGMEAARVAALRGHEVTVCEKTGKLGGNLLVAAAPEFKEDIRRLVDYLSTQVRKLGVKVELNKEVTKDLVKSVNPEVLIIATGADPLIPDIRGVDKPNVALAADVLQSKAKVGKNVVVAGGGLVGADTALLLAKQGKSVTIIEMLDSIAYNLNQISRMAVTNLLNELKVKCMTHVKLEEIADDGAIVMDKNWIKHKLPADSIVLALGYKPQRSAVDGLKGLVQETRIIGDCKEPRKIREAVHEGFVAGYMS